MRLSSSTIRIVCGILGLSHKACEEIMWIKNTRLFPRRVLIQRYQARTTPRLFSLRLSPPQGQELPEQPAVH